MKSRARTGRRGFTLIELMVALVVSSLLVGMILAIFIRMSLAYRGQQQIAGVQQVLAAGRSAFELDAKQAGLEMAQGFKIASDGGAGGFLHSPVAITNSSTGPDQVAFFYADPSTQGSISVSAWPNTVTLDSAVGFAVGDLVVMSTPSVSTLQNPIAPATDAYIATFDACILRIAAVNTATGVTSFDTAGNWGTATNTHCTAPTTNSTMLYKFIAHAYRISTTIPADGQLEMSPTGNLVPALNDWQALAYGFTDIQVATYFFDNDVTDSDGNGDPTRDWWSSTNQQTLTTKILKTNSFTPPIEMTISLVARTDRDIEGIATAATPTLIVAGNPNNNTLGDRPLVDLTTTVDPALVGSRVFRYTTFQVDLRNMGVGR